MSIGHDAARQLLGAYVLGGLEESDRHAVEAHLPACVDCREELARFAPLPALLRRLPAAAAAAGGDPERVPPQPSALGLDSLLRQARARRRTRRARAGWLVAAALVLVVALGTGLLLRPGPSPAGTTVASGTTAVFSPEAGSHVGGQAELSARPWGTSVSVSMAGLTAAGPFRLQVVAADGRTEPACTWGRSPNSRVQVVGASSMRLADIDKLTVLDRDGHVLATARLG